MIKTYKIKLPQNKEAQNIRTNIKDDTIEVKVELKEKWEPRDGDICFVRTTNSYISVFKSKDRNRIHTYIDFCVSCNLLIDTKDDCLCFTTDAEEFRPATDCEKQLLFDVLDKEGKMWDAQKKAVVDLPRWRAEEEESYFYVFIDPEIQMQVIHATDFRCYVDEKRYQLGNYFKTEEAAERVAEQIREVFKNSKAE